MKDYKTGHHYEEFHFKSDIYAMHFDNDCANIFIFQKPPKEDIIEKFNNSNPFFQIYFKSNIIFILVKFKDLDWIDIPFIHNNKLPYKINDDTSGYPCNIFIIDRLAGKLLTKRHSCFSNGLSKALYFAIEKQKANLKTNRRSIVEKINTIRASFHPNEIARLSLGR